MDTTTIRAKITALEALADPNRTSTLEHERAAAARMLARFRKLLADQASTASSGWTDNRWYGEKYADTRYLRLTEVAKLIRAEIKVARKLAKLTANPGAVAVADPIGDAPAQIKVSVRTRHGNAIDVKLSNFPDGWAWTEEADDSYTDRRPRRVSTPELVALGKAIKEIMNSYNYDGSDIITDYFDKRFYGGVFADVGGYGLRIA